MRSRTDQHHPPAVWGIIICDRMYKLGVMHHCPCLSKLSGLYVVLLLTPPMVEATLDKNR